MPISNSTGAMRDSPCALVHNKHKSTRSPAAICTSSAHPRRIPHALEPSSHAQAPSDTRFWSRNSADPRCPLVRMPPRPRHTPPISDTMVFQVLTRLMPTLSIFQNRQISYLGLLDAWVTSPFFIRLHGSPGSGTMTDR
jgi:hypothetical protein